MVGGILGAAILSIGSVQKTLPLIGHHPPFLPANLNMTTPASESASTPSTTVPQPSRIPPPVRPKAGFTRYAERLNGRLAMTAFTVVILVELVTGHGVLHWLGLY